MNWISLDTDKQIYIEEGLYNFVEEHLDEYVDSILDDFDLVDFDVVYISADEIKADGQVIWSLK